MAARAPDGNTIPGYYANLLTAYQTRNASVRSAISRNFKMWSGVNYGQWPKEAVEKHLNAKTPIHQFNFIQQKINALVGNFVLDPNESMFESESGQSNNWPMAFNIMKSIDQNRNSWQKAKRMLILNGLIHTGIAEMYVDYRADARGTVGLRSHDPLRFELDPNWATDNVNDNKNILQHAWLTAPDIKHVYKTKGEEIDSAVAEYRRCQDKGLSGEEIDKIADRRSEFYSQSNGQYLVIQNMRLENVKESRIYNMDSNTFMPDDVDPEVLKAMMNVAGSALKDVEAEKVMCMIDTVCPGLSMEFALVDSKPHPLQIGRYPFFVWSAFNVNGERDGYVSSLVDLQQSLNKTESTYSYAQQMAANGVEFVEEDFFVSPQEKNKYSANKNVPGLMFTVSSGKLSQARPGIMTRPRDQLPSDFLTRSDRFLQMADVVSSTPASVTGGEGKSGESAKLYEYKRDQALTSLKLIQDSIGDLDYEITDAYQYAAKQVYKGDLREFARKGTKIKINSDVSNMIEEAPTMSIMVVKSKAGLTVKRDQLMKLEEIKKTTQNPLYQTTIEEMEVDYIPNLTDEEAAKLKYAANVWKELQLKRLLAESKQLDAALNPQPPQMPPGMAPQGGPSAPDQAPAAGGGFSAEGVAIKPDAGIPVDVNAQNQLGQN